MSHPTAVCHDAPRLTVSASWFDLDVLVTNPNIPLETFLPPVEGFEHINMIITEDAYMLNSGTFFVRVNSWSIQFLADVLAITTYRSDKHPNPDCPDQRAFVDVLREVSIHTH